MDEFRPKSLDEIDNLFFETERSLSSGRQTEAPKADGGIPVSKPSYPEAPMASYPEAPKAAEAPAKPVQKPVQPPVMPSASPVQKTAPSGRQSLLPKQMLYKAAPMQSPITEPDETSDAYVMPKDYGAYGRDAMRINTAPAKEEKKEEEKPQRKAPRKKVKAVNIVMPILIAVTLLIYAFISVIAIDCDNSSKKLFGYYVCSVQQNTKSPVLNTGDIVFVKPVKEDKIKKNTAAAYLDKESKTYRYGIVSEIADSDSSSKIITVKGVNSKSEITENEISSASVLGTAGSYLPLLGRAVRALNRYTPACAAGAAVLLLVYIIILIAANSAGRKGKKDD